MGLYQVESLLLFVESKCRHGRGREIYYEEVFDGQRLDRTKPVVEGWLQATRMYMTTLYIYFKGLGSHILCRQFGMPFSLHLCVPKILRVSESSMMSWCSDCCQCHRNMSSCQILCICSIQRLWSDLAPIWQGPVLRPILGPLTEKLEE